jgi:hypothetical protein
MRLRVVERVRDVYGVAGGAGLQEVDVGASRVDGRCTGLLRRLGPEHAGYAEESCPVVLTGSSPGMGTRCWRCFCLRFRGAVRACTRDRRRLWPGRVHIVDGVVATDLTQPRLGRSNPMRGEGRSGPQSGRLSLRWFEPNTCYTLVKRPAGCVNAARRAVSCHAVSHGTSLRVDTLRCPRTYSRRRPGRQRGRVTPSAFHGRPRTGAVPVAYCGFDVRR